MSYHTHIVVPPERDRTISFETHLEVSSQQGAGHRPYWCEVQFRKVHRLSAEGLGGTVCDGVTPVAGLPPTTGSFSQFESCLPSDVKVRDLMCHLVKQGVLVGENPVKTIYLISRTPCMRLHGCSKTDESNLCSYYG